MNAVAPGLERVWSRRQWLIFIGGTMAFQIALILVLSKRSFPESRREGTTTTVKLAGPLYARADSDPTLFALANESGFSGRAWLRQPRPEHSLNDWQEAPRWLQMPLNRFTDEFRELARTNPVQSAAAVEQPPARIVALELAAPSAPGASSLMPDPTLARRGLNAMPSLPGWTSAEVLANSVVQVVVNAQGEVMSARLVSGSGMKPADQHALELASALRFKPLGGELGKSSSNAGLSVGNLTFRWQTLAPAVPAAKTPSK